MNVVNRHSPFMHKYHDPHKRICGCALEGTPEREVVVCPGCGAMYSRHEIMTFNVWRCYDCNNVYTVGDYGHRLSKQQGAP